MARRATRKKDSAVDSGRLKIGDDWNAITIIALSQNDPLKAIAEFVENAIDAGARHIFITRGKEKGETYLSVTDDGQGVPRNEQGIPDFKYVATHICDSVKRQLKADGRSGIQGEFGIGLLSFWTIGETLTMTSVSEAGDSYQMTMRRGDTDYRVTRSRALFDHQGTDLKIKPLLPGLRQLSGEKIQRYLASELRDRIRKNHIEITINDRTARKTLKVEPRDFDGRLIHSLPPVTTSAGEIYLELYLAEASATRRVGLYRNGTRVLQDISEFGELKRHVWASGYIEGLVDVPFVNLTPGNRLGIIADAQAVRAWFALRPIEDHLESLIKELEKAESERASRLVLKSIQKAFREALQTLPPEEYNWFDLAEVKSRRDPNAKASPTPADEEYGQESAADEISSQAQSPISGSDYPAEEQKDFFDYAGPLHSVKISPTTCVMQVGSQRSFRALAKDQRGRQVDHDLQCQWAVIEGPLSLAESTGEFVAANAGSIPALAKLSLTATQGEVTCQAEAIVTVTASLEPESKSTDRSGSGLPGYTYQHAAGELWRSRYNDKQNVIVVNNGHRDYVYAAKTRALKLRYIARLFAKEMVLQNFQGLDAERLLERLIELSLYTEENLR